MNIPLLEDRLAANPRSPLFARLAAAYEREGRYEEAIELCTGGLKEFPDYSTGHLVLARCFEATNRTVEALIEYRRVLKTVPDNLTVRGHLERIEKQEQEAFHAFAEAKLKELRSRKGKMVPMTGTPAAARAAEPTGDPEEVTASVPREAKIVTATLAEIYASQGQYDEAVRIYRRLMQERADRAVELSGRVAELEKLAAARQAELRT